MTGFCVVSETGIVNAMFAEDVFMTWSLIILCL